MKAPLTWLKDYVKIDVDVATLADKLLHAGFEVEEILYLGEGIENVVVGRIVATENHPNADKLTICSLDVDGSGETLQIVTGANNIKAGDWVPVALDGARLPGGKEIRTGELRGVESRGMLCSGGELGLTEADYPGSAAHGILILDRKGLKIGQDIKTALGLDEYVLDIGVTANRPDCQSILGIAREIGAVLNKPVRLPDLAFEADRSERIEDYVRVEVLAPDLCPRYMARVVKDIRIAPSPKFLRDRLRWAGLRPINNIVDITNFVLLELGQPMHSFDLDLLAERRIVVRRAEDGEKIVTLDGKESALDHDVLVIADGGKPVALAGIMGGENSGIRNETKTVMFESAKFQRQSIRRNSRRLGVRSDSSAMFERGVYACNTEMAADRCLNLITKLKCGTVVAGGYDVAAEKKFRRKLTVKTSQIDDVLGISIPPKKMAKILNALSIRTELAGDTLACDVPPYREDIVGYPDLAEEIIRMYGYDNIQGTMLPGGTILAGGTTASQKDTLFLERELVADGFTEIVTYSFIGPRAYDMLRFPADSPYRKSIRLLNPLGEDISLMRTTLCWSMLNTVSMNLNRKNLSGRLFELAHTYWAEKLPLESLADERPTLTLAAYGEGEDFFTMKGAVERVLAALSCGYELKRSDAPYLHAGRSADVYVDGVKRGCFGEVHPDVAEGFDIGRRVYLAELDLSGLVGRPRRAFYRDIPKFQESLRDVAVTVDDAVACGDLTETIRSAAGPLLEEARLFDVYKGSQIADGKKSLAFTLRFRAADRTLTDAEIDPLMERVVSALTERCGAELRK